MSALFVVLLITVGCGALLLTAYLIVLAGYAIKGVLSGEGAYKATRSMLNEW
ncbi:MAG: hypothetical protein V7731_01780 [Amphritea sp.]